ncbi:ead/Ea22-like family protein [Cronobacter sakazakii]|uniref:ead/Ea22-like family protein n=1 Tax=Cronobacter sakazakii TaxID=28141 RepID=UPI002234C97C
MTDTAKLKAAALAATPGEWCPDDHHGVIADAGLNANFYIASCSGPEHRANKQFIAAANPAAVLELIAALGIAQQRLAELEARKLEVIIPPRRCHDYASVAVQQRDEQWYKALHEACDRAGINLEAGGEA